MASDLLSTAQVKEHLTTELSDDALDRLINAADAYILRRVGPHDPETTMVYTKDPPAYLISLPRRAVSVESIVLHGWYSPDYTIPTTYFRLESDGRLVRIYDDYFHWIHSRHYERLKITFTPVSENAERLNALIELVRLELQDTGLKDERDDTYRYTSKDKIMARNEIMATLKHTHGGAGGILA